MIRAERAVLGVGFFDASAFLALLVLGLVMFQPMFADAHAKSQTQYAAQSNASSANTPSAQPPATPAQPTGLLITEIMYDVPGANTGRQWIEVANTSTGASAESIDLSAKTLRLFDTVSAGTVSHAHLITSYNNGTTILVPGAVAVIAENPEDFLQDWPQYSGILLKSAFSLNEAGTVGISTTDGTVLDAVNYSSAEGARGDGNSLQRSLANPGALFKAGAPTPGIVPATIPAPLASNASGMKLVSSHKSTNKGTSLTHEKTSHAVTSKTYEDKGTLAPADSADSASAGALAQVNLSMSVSSNFEALAPYILVFSSVWFAAFLALLGFSTFSLLVLQRHYYV
jgi:hypothetical protein